MDSRAAQVMQEQSRMEIDRANFNNQWQEVAERVDPETAYFTTPNSSPGQKKTEKLFDATANIALGRGGAAFESMTTPRSQQWHGLSPPPSLDKDQAVRVYLDALRDLLFRVRYSVRANFANQNSEFIRSFLNYGNGVIYVDDDPGHSLRYKGIHLAESFFAEDHVGRIDRFHRKFKLLARQLPQKFPNATLPMQVMEAAQKQPDRKFDLIHCVRPNEDRQYGRMDARGMPFSSYYILTDGGLILDESGFSTMPYIVARYRVNLNEIYGRGISMGVLPAIKTVNEMQKSNLRVGQRQADPPLLARRDGMAAPFSLRGGMVNNGSLDERGNPLVRPLEVPTTLPVALEMQNNERDVIRDAFFVTLFQILDENPTKTATQVLEEVQQRGILMSPPVGRLQTEGYGPMIEREIDLLFKIGGGRWIESQIGPMPDSLRQAGGAYEVEYTAPINKAQKAAEGVAILDSLNIAASLAQIDKRAMQPFKVPEAMRRVAEIKGYPAELLYTEDEVAEQDAQNEQQASVEQLLAAAPIVSQSSKELAQAEALSQAAPRQLPGQVAA